MNWRAPLLWFFRVPPSPEPPPGSSPRTFRAAKNYFTMRIILWALSQCVLLILPLGFSLGIFAATRDAKAPQGVEIFFRILEIFAWTVFAVRLLTGWATLRLDYELRWYMVSDRAIRIRDGITTVREKTLSLANIQDISIRQGPLQGLLHIADVEVKTAGGGGGKGPHGKDNPFLEPMHIARFRGVDNAEEIRDLLSEGVRRQRNTGLGDPDEHHPDTAAASEIDAAAALLAEVRALRMAVESGTVSSE